MKPKSAADFAKRSADFAKLMKVHHPLSTGGSVSSRIDYTYPTTAATSGTFAPTGPMPSYLPPPTVVPSGAPNIPPQINNELKRIADALEKIVERFC